MNILPIVLHMGHIPVVTFFGPVLMIFWVFRLPILKNGKHRILNLIVEFCLQYCFFKKYRHKFSNCDVFLKPSVEYPNYNRGIQTLRDKMINHFVFGRAGFPHQTFIILIYNRCESLSLFFSKLDPCFLKNFCSYCIWTMISRLDSP